MSDEVGRWMFEEAPKEGEAFEFYVRHDDFARLRQTVRLTGSSTSNVVFVLQAGVSLAGTVLTENDVPIADASVEEISHTGGSPDVSTRTDLQGRFFFPHVNEGPIKLQVEAQAYTPLSRTVEAKSNPDQNRFILAEGTPKNRAPASSPRQRVHLVGTVLDAESGRPVDRFTVLLDEKRGVALTFVGQGQNGAFDWQDPVHFFNQFALQIEADGYAPQESSVADVKGAEQVYQFKLKRASELRGQVVSPEGQAIVGAEVFLGGRGVGPSMVQSPARGYFLTCSEPAFETRTDAQGFFHFKRAVRADRIVVSHDSGYAAVSLSELSNAPVALLPWGRVEGTLRIGKETGAKQSVGIRIADALGGAAHFPFSMNATTDDAGRFVFEHVPGGTLEVFRVLNLHEGLPGVIGLSHFTNVQVQAGAASQVVVGGFGRRVIGRIRINPQTLAPDWRRDLQQLGPYYLVVNKDGAFVVDDVPPGKYALNIRLTEPPADALSEERFMPHGRELGSLKREVAIPKASSERPDEPFDLGEITLDLTTLADARKKQGR